MKIEWLVAKYIADLKRREPINVGVLLAVDGALVSSRFLGQSTDGAIDGRRVRALGDLDNYRAWVAFWQNALEESFEPAQLSEVRRSDDSFYVEPGGQRLSPTLEADLEDIVDDLFSQLVGGAPERAPLSLGKLAESTLATLQLTDAVQRDVEYPINALTGVPDHLTFDYVYRNGAAHLMRKVPLGWRDERSWDAVHAAAWTFEKANAEVPAREGRDTHCIALVRSPEAEEFGQQAEVLRAFGDVIDLSADDATDQLADSLHIGQPELPAT